MWQILSQKQVCTLANYVADISLFRQLTTTSANTSSFINTSKNTSSFISKHLLLYHHLNKHLLLYQHLKKHLLLYQQTPPPLSPPQQSLLDTQQMLEELPQPFSTLNTSEHHRSIRELADKHYRKNAEKMKLQYAKKKRHQVVTFSSGDNVTLRIPRNERSSSDMLRLLCHVLEVKRGQHRLQ